jgi:hypothetical protein
LAWEETQIMRTTWSRFLIGLAAASVLVMPVTGGSGVARAGGTTTEARLSGPAIGGVVPEGRARADARVANDGSFDTTLVVEVKNVNLPDGTLLGVSIGAGLGHPGDPCGTQTGTITLSRMQGTLTRDLGNFFPRGTSICVGFPVGPDETTILGGKFA